MLAQCPDEPLDAVVSGDETKPLHQIMVDGHGIASQSQLGLFELAVWLADLYLAALCRWAGWGNLPSPLRIAPGSYGSSSGQLP